VREFRIHLAEGLDPMVLDEHHLAQDDAEHGGQIELLLGPA
jgi:hypothetical protein